MAILFDGAVDAVVAALAAELAACFFRHQRNRPINAMTISPQAQAGSGPSFFVRNFIDF
jgi:hypothetical protein